MAKELLKALSVIVTEKQTKDGHKFMTAKVRTKLAYEAGARVTQESLDENVNLDVKLAGSCGITLPTKEGIYEVDFAEAFEDTRPEIKRPTLWIKPRDAGNKVEFVYKAPLPTLDENGNAKPRHKTICIADCIVDE